MPGRAYGRFTITWSQRARALLTAYPTTAANRALRAAAPADRITLLRAATRVRSSSNSTKRKWSSVRFSHASGSPYALISPVMATEKSGPPTLNTISPSSSPNTGAFQRASG